MKHETLRHSLLVLLNSVLCNLFKELLLQPTETEVSRLADAKVRLISQCTKLLRENFHFSCKKNSRLDFCQASNSIYLIIYTRENFSQNYSFSSGACPIRSINSSSLGVMIIWVRRLRCLPKSVVLG